MNLWSHRFSQNTNKKMSRFLPSLHRAEILTNFRLYFRRNNDFMNSFWNCLIFSNSIKLFHLEVFHGIIWIYKRRGILKRILRVAQELQRRKNSYLIFMWTFLPESFVTKGINKALGLLKSYICPSIYLHLIFEILEFDERDFLPKGQIKSKSRLARRRFSQKTNGQISFVCCEE